MYSKLKLLYDSTELDELSIIPGNHISYERYVCSFVHCEIWFLLFTYPIYLWTVALVEERVKNHDDGEGWVIGNDGLTAAKLALMDNIQPRTEDQDPGNAVKCCL